VITLIALLVGIVLAFGFLLWTRRQPDAGSRFYAVGLAVTALIYVVFAVIGRASARPLALEAGGVLLYGAAPVRREGPIVSSRPEPPPPTPCMPTGLFPGTGPPGR
jgi:hypothetical protein